MSRKKKKAKKQDFPMSDVDMMSRHIGNKFNFSLFLNRMSDAERERFREAGRKAEPKQYDDLTEAEKKAYDESQAEMYREAEKERWWSQIREFLQTIIDCKSDDPTSELFQTAKELLDIVDRSQMKPLSVGAYESQRFDTSLKRCNALVKAEIRREAKKRKDEQSEGRKGVRPKNQKKRPTKAEMANRNKIVAMAAAEIKRDYDRLPTVPEIIEKTKLTPNRVYATTPYKEGKIAKSSAKAATEMTGRSVHESQQFSETSELHSRAYKRSKAEQAELDALIEEQEKDNGSGRVL